MEWGLRELSRRGSGLFIVMALLAVMAVANEPADAQQPPTGVVISEFLAINANNIADTTGEFEDWVELWNASDESVDLGGWSISDGGDAFTFSAGTTISADGYVLLFASGDTSRTTAAEIHLPFKLAGDGEALVLRTPAGNATTPSWPAPGYPAQTADVSYGINRTGAQRVYEVPTPGERNRDGATGIVAPVTFTVPHGFYRATQIITLDTPTPSATIRYTVDGSTPTETNGTAISPGDSIGVSQTTNVRAVAYRTGWIASDVETRSYLFVQDILQQAQDVPSGWPADLEINDHNFFYGLNQDLVAASPLAIEDALLAVPSISITTDLGNLFDPADGIYVNPQGRGQEWEREASVELLDPSLVEPGFDINAGLRIRGNSSRNPNNPKHSLRLFFRDEYGGELDYPLFGTEGQDQYARVDLRTGQSWSWHRIFSGRDGRGNATTLLRDVWNRDSQGAMGQPYTRSRPYHVYLNGQYWGLYETEERVNDDYGVDYFGGSKDQYDVIKRETGLSTSEATEGTYDSWAQLWPAVSDLQVTDAEFAFLQSEVNLENLADYYLLSFLSGDGDGAPRRTLETANNWLAFRNRDGVGAAGKWVFFDRDSESALCHSTPTEANPITPEIDMTPPWNLQVDNNRPLERSLHPGWLQEALMTHPTYRQIFQDRVALHVLTPGGALTVPAMEARFEQRAAVMERIVDAEVARWGRTYVRPGFTRADFDAAMVNLRGCFELRRTVVEEQLRADGMWPLRDSPVMTPGGGAVPFGTNVTITASEPGTIYYTTDGSDPRATDGSIAATAVAYTGSITVGSDVTIKARVEQAGSWTPLTEGSFALSTAPGPVPIVLNEYNAVSSSRYLGGGGAGDPNGDDTTFGRVLGNGGDWFELAVLEDALDIRGWTIEVASLQGGVREVSARFTLRYRNALRDLRAGTLITISEDQPDDFSYSPATGDWNINLQANDADAGVAITPETQESFVIDNDDTQITVFDRTGQVVALTTGEGTVPGVGVSGEEVFKLLAKPFGDIAPDFTGYVDGTLSSWGQPNLSDDGVVVQDLGRIVFGDVTCDGNRTNADAQQLLDYLAGLRDASESCPAPAGSIALDPAEVTNDGNVDVLDALVIAQCSIGITNEACP